MCIETERKLKSYIRPLLSLSVVPVQTKFRLAEGRLSQTLTWASPLYFPPQKVMGNPDAPPAKSLIIKSTFCGNLPPFGLVQSTVFRIVWPVTNAFNNWIVCFGPQLVFNIRNTLKSMHLTFLHSVHSIHILHTYFSIFNNDTGVHFRVHSIHQDHKP